MDAPSKHSCLHIICDIQVHCQETFCSADKESNVISQELSYTYLFHKHRMMLTGFHLTSLMTSFPYVLMAPFSLPSFEMFESPRQPLLFLLNIFGLHSLSIPIALITIYVQTTLIYISKPDLSSMF